LLGDDLLHLIKTCKNFLPNTALHVLSNGRFFSYLSFCQALANIEHRDLVIGIPLYSDIPHQHNFIVQATEAFDETIRGLMNLARYGLKLELRFVIHKLNSERLAEFARFVARNLPFVGHVALMGLELVGYARSNLEALWIDPADYTVLLGEAVRELTSHRIRTSIYNHQLCLLDPHLWQYARQSISDWKNIYFDECADCAVRCQCGGFFSSSTLRHSAHIRPLSASR